ncbi:hypothetical protein Bca4012_053223 [Brassica carinata]
MLTLCHEGYGAKAAVDDECYFRSGRVSGGLLPELFSDDIALTPSVSGSLFFSILRNIIFWCHIFENRIFSPAEILSKAIFCAREWIVAQPSHSAQTASAIRPPQATTETTCYTDAAWSQATNRAGCGWCFMNHENVVFLQDARAFEFISSPLMAEAIAIRSALLHALKAEILEICIKSDCQALIVALSSKRHPADLYGITRDIKTLSLPKSVMHSSFPN